ncbi:sodium-dependent phosphate transport protein 2B-like [Saccoglossus kowalevskii]|uniref:Sodium-dependent phosphate transport protein 2B-like n=1 Tax=Saccoglossus kowalevskii TaxID=10224 RepID=A0ABM0MVU7_SACKO|nr:PREDICTED: sodium-dependent phosphate transport protein 2B-like [Saccoglossus kowalevskii]
METPVYQIPTFASVSVQTGLDCYDDAGLDDKTGFACDENNTVPPSTELVKVILEKKEVEKEVDPWDLPDLKNKGTPWSELTVCGKIKRVITTGIVKPALLLALLYLFICSLDFLSSAFRLLGGRAAGEVIGNSIVATNPICGLMVGVLATVLVQSSSTTTSIVVAMVASGIIDVKPAIPIVMGANIGTSVTNTIVSVFHAGDRNEFRRAFAGATVHDMFNWLSVIVLLPLELITSYLYRLTDLIVKSLHLETNEEVEVELLKVLTKPFTKLVIQIDKKVITNIAKGDMDAGKNSLVKVWCEKGVVTRFVNETFLVNKTEIIDGQNVTQLMNDTRAVEKNETVYLEKCNFLFSDTGLNDSLLGVIILLIALAILCICLVLIVKLLHSILRGRIAVITKKVINSNLPGKLAWLTGYIAIMVGAGLTMLVQSSSIFTSALTPLVGIGVISVNRMYPFTLGANIGTTFTAMLAALASSGDDLNDALQIALCHFFFNISGIIIWYPIPFMRRVPIKLAKFNGNTTAKYRWFSIFYLVFMFFVFPAVIFGLSLAGWQWMAIVGIPVVLLCIFILIVNVLQVKCPGKLPTKLKTWNFLPLWMRSLAPLDRIITKILAIHACRRCLKRCQKPAKSSVPQLEGVDSPHAIDIMDTEMTNKAIYNTNL